MNNEVFLLKIDVFLLFSTVAYVGPFKKPCVLRVECAVQVRE